VDITGPDPVDDFLSPVAQHALGADVEQLDDAFFVGGDDREIGAVEDRVLQRPRLEQRFLTPHFGDASCLAALLAHGGATSSLGHGYAL
jgi:hypothetical protein